MFHTFQTTSVAIRSPGLGDDSKTSRPSGRRISTSNACVECRRRKIRCDGMQPCGQCQWYQHPESCNYAKPAQRVVPSRKLVEKLQSSIEQHQMVLKRIFGSKDLEALISLPREELLNMALSQPAAPSPSITPSQQAIKGPSSHSEGAHSLEALEEPPDHDSDYEDFESPERLQSISDDVNGLSMKIDRQPSYIGVSSVNAAMKVIFRVAPMARRYMRNQSMEISAPGRSTSPISHSKDPMAMPSLEEGTALVDSFFQRIHPFFPMLDEESFRQTYQAGVRKDSSWMALINMVFTLGSFASGSTSDETHAVYYKRARAHTIPRIETFGNPNVEVLQALAMMGGYYLHYLNRPNEADALMGATLRAACALGVHREYVAPLSSILTTSGASESESLSRRVLSADVRRRTWWSLFCLDTWATTTTGRPSLGRVSPGVTVREPGSSPENVRVKRESPHSQLTGVQSADPTKTQNLKLLPLIHNTAFCKIATIIQDKLSSSPQIPFDEVVQLDAELVRWWDDLPTILTKDPDESIPKFLRVPRLVMKWRYHNLRIILHRPYLLSSALRRATFSNLTGEEKLAVGKCRIIAANTIESIASECKDDMISGWNGVWLAYQATFVPLVSLFTDSSVPEECDKWRSTVNTAITFFSRMKDYSIAAERSRQVVSRLLEAAKQIAETADARRRQEQAMKAVVAQRDRDVQQYQQASKKTQQNFINSGTPHSGTSMSTHSPSHSQSSLEQLTPANIPHPAMGLPIGTMAMGLGMSNVATAGLHVSTAGMWHDSIPAGGMGSITPQGMPHGGAFWDEMMWDNFTPIAEHPPQNPFGIEGYVDSPSTGNWSPHTNDIPNHPHHAWGGYHHNQQM